MNLERNSPQFKNLISWIRNNDIPKLRQFFPLGRMKKKGSFDIFLLWIRWKYKKYYEILDVEEVRKAIFEDLVNPLFIQPEIKVRDEDNLELHKKDNLFCLNEILLRDLNNIRKGRTENDVSRTLRKFDADLKKFLPKMKNPYSWALDTSRSGSLYEIQKEIKFLSDRLETLWNAMGREIEDSCLAACFGEWKQKGDKKQRQVFEKRFFLPKDEQLNLLIQEVEYFSKYLKAARGKRGHHPMPFNVFTYHLINRFTFWKWDKDREFILKKDGQHKLERDWSLIVFFLLDVHSRRIALPGFDKFITLHARSAAADVLRILKKDLWNRYKNFPPKEGRVFPHHKVETGFRRLILTNEDRLRVVAL
jgi:hypothetical protein